MANPVRERIEGVDLINREIESRNRATMLSGVSMAERALIGLVYAPVGFLADRSLPLTFVLLGIAALAVALLTKLPAERPAETEVAPESAKTG